MAVQASYVRLVVLNGEEGDYNSFFDFESIASELAQLFQSVSI